MAIRVASIAAFLVLLVAGAVATAAVRVSAAPPVALTITSISPAVGPAGKSIVVTIKGTGFPVLGDCEQPSIDVKFGGLTAFPMEPPTSTQVRVSVPVQQAGLVDVTVQNPCSGMSATVTGGYRYLPVGIIGGSIPKTGFGLFVFGGGTDKELVTASNCDPNTATFWATDASGHIVTYIPGATVAVVNAPWDALFPSGIPFNTALIGRCA